MVAALNENGVLDIDIVGKKIQILREEILIDIIGKKHKKWYFRHTSHIKKYNKLYREDFNELSKKIILKIK